MSSDALSCCTPCPSTTTVNVPGPEGPSPTLLPTLSDYTSGAQALTDVYVQALASSITLNVTGHHIIYAVCRFQYNVATISSNQIVSLKLRRINNTASDVTNAVGTIQTQIVTALSGYAGSVMLCPVDYNGTAGDIIEPMIKIDDTTFISGGSVDAYECSILAFPLA